MLECYMRERGHDLRARLLLLRNLMRQGLGREREVPWQALRALQEAGAPKIMLWAWPASCAHISGAIIPVSLWCNVASACTHTIKCHHQPPLLQMSPTLTCLEAAVWLCCKLSW